MAVIAAGAVAGLLSIIVGLFVEPQIYYTPPNLSVHDEPGTGHATLHMVFGALAVAVALWVGHVRRATLASGLAERGLDAARLIAFMVSATAVVEGIGAYPQFEVLHAILVVNVLAVRLLLLCFLFIAAVGVGRLVRRGGAERST